MGRCQYIVLVCSSNYIRNKWKNRHFRQQLERKIRDKPYCYVVVILLEDPSYLDQIRMIDVLQTEDANRNAPCDMPWQWTNCTAVVQRSSRLFWSKLCHVLRQPKVFVSYNDNESDRQFVSQLANRLKERGFRLHLQHRDFVAGQALADGLEEAVNQCHYTLMVCSAAYINNHWCIKTFRQAFDRMINERPGYLIIILFDDAPQAIRRKSEEVDEDSMEEEDLLVWTWSKCTIIRPNTCWFWNRLCFALRQPDIVNDSVFL